MRLSRIAEDYDPSTNWEDYVISSGYTVDSLKTLYHGTSADKFKAIMKSGLDPNLSVHVDDEIDNDYDPHFGPPYAYVYLSTYPRICMKFAPGGDYCDGDNSNAVLLEITLPDDLKKQLILDRGEFIRAPFLIPPKYIRKASNIQL